MAYINKEWKRLVRIYGKPDALGAHRVNVIDSETKEDIKNIKAMTIRLNAREVSECEITYHEVDEHGQFVKDPNNGFMPIESTITLPDINIAGISVYEVDSWEERFDRTFCLYEPTEDGYENAEEKVKAFIRGLLSK